jgi:hypothetical protein
LPRGQKITINWRTPTGVPPREGILVTFKVTYKGVTKKFTTNNAVLRENGSYSLDSNALARVATELIDWMNNRLPTDFDPNTVIVLDDPVAVSVTPILDNPVPRVLLPWHPPLILYGLGAETWTTSDLTVTLVAG